MLKDVKLTDLSQVETLIQSTQAFTEQMVIMNRLLQEINNNTSSQVGFFTSRDGFVKLMDEIIKADHSKVSKEVKSEINMLYLKLAATLAGIIGISIGLLKIFGG